MAKALFDYEERLTEFDRVAIAGHDRGDLARPCRTSIWFIIFMASMMHRTWPTLISSPISMNAFAPGEGAAVEGADHRRGDDVLVGLRLGGGGLRGSRRCGLRGRLELGLPASGMLAMCGTAEWAARCRRGACG